MEQREYDQIEETILSAEEAVETCQVAANDPTIASNGAKLTEAFQALNEAETEVARLYDRWTELSAKLEQVQHP